MSATNNYCILRVKKIQDFDTLNRSGGHTNRTSNEKFAHVKKGLKEPIRFLHGDADWVQDWKTEVEGMHLRKLKMGQRHVIARELFLGMSPEWMEGKTQQDVDEWAKQNLTWLKARFGENAIRSVVLHLDEQTPHLAVYLAGKVVDPKGRGNGWTLSDRSLGLGGGVTTYELIQDEYAEAMKKFGLERGRRGSEATHQTTKEWRKQMARPLDQPINHPTAQAPSLKDRIDVAGYGQRVAEQAGREVYTQMRGYQRQAKAQAAQLKAQAKELGLLREALDKLSPLADLMKQLLAALLGHPPDLNSLEGLEEARKATAGIVAAIKPPAPIPDPVPDAPESELREPKPDRPARRRRTRPR